MGTTPSRPRKIGVVSELNIYPLKGAKGQRVQTAEVGDCGFQGDREFILVDETNLFTSQRKIGALAKVSIAVKPGDSITVSFDRDDFLTVPLVTEGEAETLTVWGKKINGLYQGDKVSHWFNRVLKQNGLRLFWGSPAHTRPVEDGYAKGDDHVVRYADGYPYLLTTTKSLQYLNGRLNSPVLMDRFRPNIVVGDCAKAWEEDSWRLLKINGITFQACKPCERCAVPTIDQSTGISTSGEPIKTLATFHRVDGKITFGMNLVSEERMGAVSVGDEVFLLT